MWRGNVTGGVFSDKVEALTAKRPQAVGPEGVSTLAGTNGGLTDEQLAGMIVTSVIRYSHAVAKHGIVL